ncbi:MAG: P pilus assembly chaperone PapD [Paraglaciecola sp.]|jgi:P pilus assembly chaperone PapD
MKRVIMKRVVMKKLLVRSLLNIVGISTLFLGSVIWQHNAHGAASISFSKYRFVFDDKLRQDSLVLSNSGSSAAICNLSAENFLMSADGPLKLATENDEILNSAEKIIRYSPRRVTLNAASKQTVRIASRRRPNIKDGEYLSYLKISCIEQTAPNQAQRAQIAVNANFVYYIPLQVRMGKLMASTRIENAKISSSEGRYSVSFDHIREGNRSVVGNIAVVEKKSGNSLGLLNNTVIYMPFTKKQHKISLNSPPEGPVEIIFTEEQASRGSLVAKTTVQP